ncbi:DUF1735 domain-containing protein [Bacteroides difficilis]|uniref:DUF1735 domain-containing protein n=1 Tax=Bacteroides difficilis TaxID=2763021 RepID=A0ABR7C658_9BACE|nr:DUF1735 domain-containing protein [Bacteroides difficilis]MBC5603295.1 DUF1735 domain-containing protein [Bacteroides difficilis]
MKYNNFLFCFLLSVIVAFSSACNDDNEEAGNLACFQESGYVAAEFSYQDDNFEQTMTVLNRGMGTFNTQITPYTQAEMAAYNQKNGTNYHVMPEGTYKLSETNLSFTDSEKAKNILVTMYPNKLFEVIRKDTESKQYALPLKVGSRSNSGAIYVVNMNYPVLKLSEEEITLRMVNEEEEKLITACTYEEQEATEPIPNKGNISLDLAIPNNAEEWLKEYNTKNGTGYQLLPSTAYELDKMTGTEGEEQCSASIKVKRTLSSGEPLGYDNYIVPIKLTGIDNKVAVNHDIHIIKVINTNEYNDVEREYDDGKNCIFHVKIAIDKPGYEMSGRDMRYFQEKIAIQWEAITERFNALDKNGLLKRNYIFVPDVKDIIVYDENYFSRKDNPRIPYDKFQLIVCYDFYKDDNINMGGGSYSGDMNAGIDLIGMGAHCKNAEEFDRVLNPETSGFEEALAHELGHFRGLLDTYLCDLSSSNNKINGQSFTAEWGNMMGAYNRPIGEVWWSDYEAYVINVTGAKHCAGSGTVAAYFPENMEVTVTEQGKPCDDFTLKFYPKESGIIKSVKNEFKGTKGVIQIDARKLFWEKEGGWNNRPYAGSFYKLFLVEAINKKTGKKAYKMLPYYDVHKQGLIDKSEKPIDGESTFKYSINID